MSHTHPCNLRSQKRKREEELEFKDQLYNIRSQKWKRDDEELEFEDQFPHELPREVMELIFGFLKDWLSRIRFSVVSKSWRWVAHQCIRFKLGQPLWLLHCRTSDSDTRDFSSFSEEGDVIHTIHIPEARGMHCCGSSQGWLIMQNHGPHLNKLILLNPLSKAIIHLPLKAKVKTSIAGEYLRMKEIYKAILSSAPDQCEDEVDGDCLVAAIDIHGHLYVCRTSDGLWTKQYDIRYTDFIYKDILFHERSLLYGIEFDRDRCMVLSFSPDLNFKAKSFSLNWHLHDNHRFLAECFGKVVCVSKSLWKWHFSEIGYQDLESKDDRVYDGVLFIDRRSCRYLSVNDYNGMNLCHKPRYSMYHHGTGVFELEGGRSNDDFELEGGRSKSNPFPLDIALSDDSNVCWYTPNIRI